jgi:radical SAM superfamily enzyme YgiQ (UPF0313 family)
MITITETRSPADDSGAHRRIVLVDFFWTRDQDPRIPLGHASLLAQLRRDFAGDVRSLVVPVNVGLASPSAIAASILDLAGSLPPTDVDIAIGAYVWGEALIQHVLPLLRAEGFRGRIILGGPQISYAGPGIDRAYPDADVFVRGYGENALLALACKPGRPAIRGVHYAGEPDRAEQAEVDLDELPSPLLDGTIPLLSQKLIRWETQRGCPFRCSFCQHREAGARLTRRDIASGRVWEEVDLLGATQPARISVLDPIFNTGPRATAILERLSANGFRGRLSLQCRAEYVDLPFLEAARKLDVCLEFGLQTIHDAEGKAVHRRNSMPGVEEALAQVRARGIDHEITLIFGLPHQTLASFQETVRWCLERRVPVIKAFPLMLLRGTELERDRDHWDLIEDGEEMPVVVASSTFTRWDWHAMSRISEALRSTEGRHPPSLAGLLDLADASVPTAGRWRPEFPVPARINPSSRRHTADQLALQGQP